jgi:hypothetical protein
MFQMSSDGRAVSTGCLRLALLFIQIRQDAQIQGRIPVTLAASSQQDVLKTWLFLEWEIVSELAADPYSYIPS